MKLTLSSIALSIALISVTAPSFAQDLTFNDKKPARATVARDVTNADELNATAVKDFTRNFRNVSNVRWTKNENGSSAYYQADGVDGRVTYDKKGKREYVLLYYNESRLPADVRHQVKSTYYDYKIGLVTEVVRNSKVYYVVKLENEAEIVTLQVSEDGMQAVKTIRKSA